MKTSFIMSQGTQCLEQLKKFLLSYTGDVCPTHEILREAWRSGADLPSDPNVFATYHSSVGLAVERAVLGLQREHPGWTPSWDKDSGCRIKVRARVANLSGVGSYVKPVSKGVNAMGKKKKKVVLTVPSEEEMYYLDILMDMYHDNNYRPPSRRQMDRSSMYKTEDLLRVLGKGQGWTGVEMALQREIKRRTSSYNMAIANSGTNYREVVQRAVATMESREPKDLEPVGEETVMENVAKVVQTQETVTVAVGDTVEAVSNETTVAKKPKGGRRTSPTPEEALVNLVRCYGLLGNRVPTHNDLNALSHKYPGEIRAWNTLVKYVGPSADWHAKIQEYLAREVKV